jgi:hypothetical protein
MHKVKVENEDSEKEPEYRLETLEVFGCGDCSTWDPNREDALELFPNPDIPRFVMKGANPVSENCVQEPEDQYFSFDREDFLSFHRSPPESDETEVHWKRNATPLEVASADAFFKIDFAFIRLVLFRRDDWRSVCLKQKFSSGRGDNAEIDYTNIDVYPETPLVCLPEKVRGICPLKVNGTLPNVMRGFTIEERIWLEAVVPPPGHAEEPKWLKEMRKDVISDLDWTTHDEEELLRVENFSFRFKSVSIEALATGQQESYLHQHCYDREQLWVLFENFDWK